MNLSDVTVEVRNRDFKRLGMILPEEMDLEVDDLHNNVGEWTLTLGVGHRLAEALATPGAGIIVTGPDDVLFSGPMVTTVNEVKTSDPLGTLTYNGVSDSVVLADMVALPDPTNINVAKQTKSHDVRTGRIESLMHQYVAANIGPKAPIQRRRGRPTDELMREDTPNITAAEAIAIRLAFAPQVIAARAIVARLNGQTNADGTVTPLPINADWTWAGCPPEVSTYGPGLKTSYTASKPTTDDEATQKAWLNDYVVGHETFEDWTWTGSPTYVNENNDLVRNAYLASGGNLNDSAASITWLNNYATSQRAALPLVPGRTYGYGVGVVTGTTDQQRGRVITKRARFAVLGTLLEEMGRSAGLAFRVVQRGDNLVFETRSVTDRSKYIRLSVLNDNLTSQKVAITAPGVTQVIIAGTGELIDRTFVQGNNRDSIAAQAEWARRIERFVDQRQTDDSSVYETKIAEELAKDGYTGINVQVVPNDESTMRFQRDWGLGDRVAIVVGNVERISLVTGYILKADASGFRFGVVLGDPAEFDQSASTAGRISDAEKRLSALERAL